MQLNRDAISKFPGKKGSSRTNFPNQQQTYVIAFALKETYDDLVTAQQMICNKRSPQPSTNSLTPTNSLKLIDSTQTVKLDQIPDTAESTDKFAEESKASEEICQATIEINSSGSNIGDDQNKIICFIETDATSDSSNDEKADNDKQSGETLNVIKPNEKLDEKSNDKSGEPEIIFNATNYTQRYKDSKFIKRKPKIHKTVAPKCNKFKCKTPKNSINNRLEKYYEKVKQNSTKSDQLRDGISKITTVVPRAMVLKNSFAKENLLDDAETTSIEPNEQQFNENDDGSQCSYPSTTKNDSFISNSSGTTLTYVPSRTSLENEDLNSVGTVKSKLEISIDSSPLYKSDVTVAVAFKNSKSITSSEKITNNEKFMNLASLTSNLEPIPMEMSQLTSEFECIDRLRSLTSREKFAHENEMSNVTLVNKRSNFDISSDDLFDMARTSSDFNEKTSEASILKKDTEYQSSSERKDFKDNTSPNMTQQSILETVINLGYYPEVTPSTSSAVAVTVVDHKDTYMIDGKNFHVCSKNMGDHLKETKFNSNIFTKQCNGREKSPTKKPVLPNHEEIKEMLNDDKQHTKNTEESKNTFRFSEMWDKLILMLDVAFKRLETTIADKIIRELKLSIKSIDLHTQSIGADDMDLEKGDIIVIEPSKHEVISTQDIKETETGQQCNLVQSEVIDEIMQTLSSQVPKKIEPGQSLNSLKKYKSKLISKYLEVLKPPIVGPKTFEDRGDTVTISTDRTETFNKVHRIRVSLYSPVRFVRENLFVITSVPAFFVILVLVYGILVLVIQP